MPCFHPLTAWKILDEYQVGDKKFVVFKAPSRSWLYEKISLPCGQCIGCRLERSRQWAIRCVHEASLHDKNCFLTLTYDDEHLPKGNSLNVDDIQKFFKKLRRRIEPDKLRFFQCGEYGSLNARPHHHCIIFGYDFPDRELFFQGVSGNVYRSAMLEDLWPYGYSSIGDVTFESAAYVARYVLKKINGKDSDEHYKGRKPEFITMSRRPGIGAAWFDKYKSDVYPKDFITIQDGLRCRPPKFYDKLYEVNHEFELAGIKEKRRLTALSPSFQYEVSKSRLAIKEQCKSKLLKEILVRNQI